MADNEEDSLPAVEVPESGDLAGDAPSESDALHSLEPVSSDTNLGPSDQSQTVANKDLAKIDVYLKATGNAPIMKRKKWTVSQDQHIGWIAEFIKKYLKLDPNERLFLYINQTFAPAPDQTVKNLYDCYGIDGKLVIHYCKSHAWG
ncbi:autophagy protein 12-like [Diprion similis]|uniref:autophagy protein 12-like n=1 Tax=Diprion similis TaxID=362088 RepID=UPI001EF7BB67|nr:autophagy protein 12-like [Diprion similis]XP_046750815.1 autophagy protein 12-like [Diprion similis]